MKNWPVKKLSDVCEISAGGSAPQGEKFFKNGKFPFFRTYDIGQIHLSKNFSEVRDYLNEEGAKKLKLYKKGTILFPKSGASIFSNHRVIMGCDGYVSSHLATISSGEKIKTKFVFFFLLLVDAKKMVSNSSYPSLKISDIGNIEIPVPPLETQKKIVAKIEELMDKINQAKQLRTQAQQDASHLLPAALHQIFGIQAEKESWKERDLGELFDITSSKRVFKHEWKNSGVPFYRAREIVNLSKGESFKTPIFISEHLYKKYKNKYGAPKAGDILVTGVGTLGVSYVVDENDKFYFKDGNIIWFKKKEDVSSVYVNYFFKSPNLKERIESNSAGATVKTFTIQTAKKTKIPLPPTQEQKEIVKYLDSLSEKTRQIQDLQSQTATELNDLEQSILHKAFKGELIE
jgi:type I restriction enzyme S subunit